MTRIGITLLAGLALALSAGAQTASNSQASASGNTQASAEAKSSTSATASQQAQAARRSGTQQPSSARATGSTSASNSASASANAGPASANLASGTTVNATLLTSLDARHNKPGDRVQARVEKDVKQDGRVVLRRGTRLMGHVTQAQARSKESSESSLGIQFDRAVPKNGEERPVSFAIQALAAAQTQSDTALENNDELLASGAGQTAGSAGGGGVLRGGSATTAGVLGATGNAVGSIGQTAGAAVGTTTDAATSAAGNASEFNATGHLTSGSRGVIGLQGLQLNSAVESVTQGSVVTSSSQNVHLASGTQMVLRAVSQ